MKADVYRNLNKDGKFSIRSRESDTYGKVVDYASIVRMRDCEFVVQQSGYEKYQENQEKTVHAFVRGDVIFKTNFPSLNITKNIFKDIFSWNRVRYNPDYRDSFYNNHRGKVTEAKRVICLIDRVFYTNNKDRIHGL